MRKRILGAVIVVAAVLVQTACLEAPKTTPSSTEAKKEPPKPPEPVAAQLAFYEMYKPARTWAADALPLSLASNELPSLKNEGGKAAMWTGVFVSPSRREARTFTYSVIRDGAVLKGLTVGGSQSWSGPTPKSRPFQEGQFVVNSDQAYQIAFEKAQAWVKKHPEKKSPALFLGSASRFPAPVWFVLWGTTKSGYAAYVNAVTGKLITGK